MLHTSFIFQFVFDTRAINELFRQYQLPPEYRTCGAAQHAVNQQRYKHVDGTIGLISPERIQCEASIAMLLPEFAYGPVIWCEDRDSRLFKKLEAETFEQCFTVIYDWCFNVCPRVKTN